MFVSRKKSLAGSLVSRGITVLPSDIFLFGLKGTQYKLIAEYKTAMFVATNYFKGKASHFEMYSAIQERTFSQIKLCSNDNFESVNIACFQDL
jgi:hypothetical protein